MKIEIKTQADCRVIIDDAINCISVQIIQPSGKSELYSVNKVDGRTIGEALLEAVSKVSSK